MNRHLANIVTSIRILGSVPILLFPAFSVGFYIAYAICGISDMIDGTIARKSGHVSEFGSRLDTVADLIFMSACAVKILPNINIPLWLWIWIIIIAAVKIINIILGFVIDKKLVLPHTKANKITGALLFISPLTLTVIAPPYTIAVVCFSATAAAIEEVCYISPNNRT